MERDLKYLVVYWLMAYLIALSSQADVGTKCADSESNVQCYSVSFTRSVFEGLDDTVTPENDKDELLLTVFSNTASTSSLMGYNVSIATSCNSSVLSVTQVASSAPTKCKASLMECSAQGTVVLLEAHKETIRNDVFYAQLKMPLPPSKFDLSILPQFDDEVEVQNTMTVDSGFTAQDIGTVESTGKSAACKISNPNLFEPTIVMIGILALLLLLAAICGRLYGACAKNIVPRRSAGGDKDRQKNQVELQKVGETSNAEKQGNYSKNPDV